MEGQTSHDPKKKKSRPPRGRGLRTTTGCLTCRKRRLKCDEDRPACGQCHKSERECVYAPGTASAYKDHDQVPIFSALSKRASWDASDITLSHDSHGSPDLSAAIQRRHSGLSSSTFVRAAGISARSTSFGPEVSQAAPRSDQSPLSYRLHLSEPQAEGQSSNACRKSPVDAAISPVTQAASVTPGRAPYEWWDLLAHDAANSVDSYKILEDHRSRWSFDPVVLSRSRVPSPSQFLHNRQQSQEQQVQQISRPPSARGNRIGSNHDNVAKEPWNTSAPLTLSEQDLHYLKYYIDKVGPIFDLFDPARTFTEFIPHLAMRNVGLLKSVLAVSARFKSLHTTEQTPSTKSDSHSRHRSSFTDDDDATATQFYFETLGYLSHAMQYQSYTRSQEILATANMISSYELFHVDRSADWEKHLKGVFWIQRSQDTNGEREGLPGAVWWNWLRQDIWAALSQNRKPLTIWEPTKLVSTLRGHEFASRATYLLARSIKCASQDTRDSTDLGQRIAEGERNLKDLQEWYSLLPPTYRPLPAPEKAERSSVFPPIWVHPPYHAAALQHYYSALILTILNHPSFGVSAYHDRQRMLDDAVSMICGLAQSPTALEFPSAMVHFQALYVAGQCVRTPEQQSALYIIFERVLESNRFPTTSLLSDLQKVWRNFS